MVIGSDDTTDSYITRCSWCRTTGDDTTRTSAYDTNDKVAAQAGAQTARVEQENKQREEDKMLLDNKKEMKRKRGGICRVQVGSKI